MKDEAAVPEQYKKPKPRTSVQLSAGDVDGVGVGDKVSVTITGKVVGVTKDSYVDGPKNYRIEVEDYETSIESNGADKALKEMTGDAENPEEETSTNEEQD